MKQLAKLSKLITVLIVIVATGFTAKAATYYWVGGSGNWSDFSNHWATSSGGGVFHSQVPSQFDDVVFDANSFLTTNRVVTQDVEAYCRNMSWNSPANNPTYNSSKVLHIYGSIKLASAMTFNYSTTLQLDATTSGNTIDLAGKTIAGTIQFNGQGQNTGVWTLQNKLATNSTIDFQRGTLISNGHRVEAGSFWAWYNNPMTLNFTGTDTIFIQNEWRIYPTTSINLTMGLAVIKLINGGYFGGGNKTYSDIVAYLPNSNSLQLDHSNTYRDIKLKGTGINQTFYFYGNSIYNDITIDYSGTSLAPASIYFTGSNTARDIAINHSGDLAPTVYLQNANTLNSLSVNGGATISLAGGQTQTLTALTAIGSCSKKINIFSNNTALPARISKLSGVVNVDYVNLQDVTAQGGATFNATNSRDFGGNSGWNISGLAATTFYWIGGSGNWNDPAHWSTTSGGAPAGCGGVPSRIDNAVFDANSFTAPSQYVTMDNNVECKNITWTSASNNPTFNMAGRTLNVFGSLTFTPNMTVQSGGTVILESKVVGNTVSTYNHLLSNVYFRGQNVTTGKWTLSSRLRVSNYIYMERGNFSSGGQQVECTGFYNWTGATASLDFTGTDTVYVGYEWRIYPNSTLNMGTAVIKQTIVNNYGYFIGGNKTYNDVVVNYTTPGYQYYVEYSNTFNDWKMNVNGFGNIFFYQNNTFRDIAIHFTSANTSVPSLNFNGANTIRNASFTAVTGINPTLNLSASNSFSGMLTLGEGYNVVLGANQTQTVANLTAVGTCARKISITSNSPGTAGRISKTSGTVNADWLKLQDVTALGGATFNTTNTLDFGNVTGWNITGIAPTNYYWVGGSGNWTDANHWANSSGGTPSGCSIPTRADNVIFDINSFTAPGQTVTLNAAAECRSFSWNNVTNNPSFNGGGQSLSVYGSFKLDPNMTFNAPPINFESKVAGNSINTAGKTLSNINFNGQGSTTGEWSLQSNLTSNSNLTFQGGSFKTNGYRMNIWALYAQNNKALTLDFTGTDTVTVSYQWVISTSNAINLIKGGMNIYNNYNYDFYFSGGNKTYNDIISNYTTTGGYQFRLNDNNVYRDIKFSGNGNQQIYIFGNSTYNDVSFTFNNNTGANPNIQIYGNNTFNDVSVTSVGNAGPYCYIYNNNTFNNLTFAGLGTRIYLGSGFNQTVNNLVALGSGGFPVFLQSTTIDNQATITKTSGNVCLDFVWMRDIKATGGATFNAGASSTNIGNNTGWAFTSCLGYYWVGGSGNWSDLAHWATSSGGSTKHVALPTQFSNVYFDANSFSATNQTVNIDISDPRCLNMSWLSSLNNPTLAGSSADLNIYGSLALVSGMNQNYTGNFNFKATATGFTINSASKTLQNINLDGIGGGWTLTNNLKVAQTILLLQGSFNTNGKDVEVKDFQAGYSNVRSLSLGASNITLTNGGWYVFDNNNLTFNAGTSKFIMTGSGPSGFSFFHGNGLTYNNVTFTTNSTSNVNLTGANTFNVLRFESGVNATIPAAIQKTTSLQIEGSCNRQVSISSSSPGVQATFNQTSGTVNARFVNLRDNKVQGGATFNANLSNNNGNVTGWNFTSTSTLTLTMSKTDASCPGRNNGIATVAVSGGSAPYNYLWSTSETSNSIAGLIPGTYSVTVTDANGCTSTGSVTITQPPFVTATASNNGPVCPGANITLSASGGETYAWTGPNNFTSTDQNPLITSVTALQSGVYTVKVSNADGCSATATTTINTADNIKPTVQVKPATLYLDANGSATLTTSMVDNGSTDNCGIASITLSKENFTCQDINNSNAITPTYIGAVSQETRSHGGGYNPHTKEFWYPEWAGYTIYKYNAASHSFVGSFNAPQNNIMQLWMDRSSTDYFTANWGHARVYRMNNNAVVWSYATNGTAAAITTSNDYVYTLNHGSNMINVLAKSTGTFVKALTLAGPIETYGGMAYANNKLYIAGYAHGFGSLPYSYNVIHVFDASNGAYINSVSTIVTPYNMAFDGETMWISNNSNTIYGYKIANGDAYGGNTVPVTVTVTDATGNSANAIASVKVLDTLAPIITDCPANIEVETGASSTSCGKIVSWTAPTIGDNCSYTTNITSSPTAGLNSGSIFPVGITTITYTVKDASGNISTCSFTVKVVDNTPPAIACPANISVNNDPGKCGAVVNYAIPGNIYTTGAFDNSIRKINPSNYSVESSVTITAPNTYVYQTTGMAKDPTTGIVYAILHTSNNMDGRPLARIDLNTGAATIVGYTGDYLAGIAFSGDGTLYGVNGRATYPYNTLVRLDKTNASSTVLTTLNGNSGHSLAFNTDDGMLYHWSYNLMEKINPSTLAITNISQSGNAQYRNAMAATYIGNNEFLFTDRNSNDLHKVNANGVSTFLGYIYHYAKGIIQVTGSFGGTVTDNCEASNVTVRQVAGLPSGAEFPLGTTTNTFEAVDAAGNVSATCSFDVTVSDKEGPAVRTNNITVELDANGSATITADDLDNGTSDVCNNPITKSISKTTFTCDDITAVNTGTMTYVGEVSQNPHSHGGGYNPITNEFWYPQWADPYIYTYNSTHQQTGSLYTGQYEMMQVWMDKTSGTDYYTANWGHATITRRNGSNEIWSYPIGYYASGVSTDENYVYAIRNETTSIIVLDKNTGSYVREINIPAHIYTQGCFVYYGGKFYIGGYAHWGTTNDNNWNAIHTFDAATGNYESSTQTLMTTEYGVAFDGNTMWISNGWSTIYGYQLSSPGVPVTFTATDALGNSNTATVYVKVVDKLAPVVNDCPENIVVNVNAANECSRAITWAPPTAKDNCSYTTTITSSPTAGLTTPGAVFPIGTTTITYTFTDPSGNVSTCSFDVTLQTPEITVRGNGSTIVNGDNTPSTSDHTDFGGTIPGNVVTKTYTITNNGTGELNVSKINIAGTDAADFTLQPITLPVTMSAGSSITFDVSFNSAIPGFKHARIEVMNSDCDAAAYTFAITGEITCTYPAFTTCSDNITVGNDAGRCDAIVNYALAVSGIPAPSLTYTFTGATHANGNGTGSGAVFNKGTTTVTVTAKNPCGSISCKFTVTVEDDERPTITCAAAVTAQTSNDGTGNCTTTANLETPSTGDNCSVASVKAYVNGNEINPSTHAFAIGTTTVKWIVTDGSGLTAECTQNVTVTDDERPTITCAAAVTAQTSNDGTGNCTTTANLGTPSTGDNCSVASVKAYVNGNEINPSTHAFTIGTTTVKWIVTDGSGLTAECTQNVTVTDDERPTIICAAAVTAQTSNDGTGNCTTTANLETPSTGDNCSIASVKAYVNGNEINPSTHAFTIGTTTVKWIVTDGSGLTAECTQNVTVTDDERPTITCAAAITAQTSNDGTGNCTTTANLETPSTGDNCSVASVKAYVNGSEINPSTYAFAIGTTTVKWIVTDGSGLTAECTQTVTVTDDERPTITCAAAVTAQTSNDGTGNCTTTANLETPSTGDNCSIASVKAYVNGSEINPSTHAFAIGTTTVKWIVTDGSGLTAECTQNVTVTDDERPTITCPKDIIANTSDDGRGNCSTTVELGSPITGDNCSVASVKAYVNGNEINTNYAFGIGQTVVKWIVTDANGLTTECAQTVTITDDENPTIICVSNKVKAANNTACSYKVTGSEFDPVATNDNCSVAQVRNNYNNSSSLAGAIFPEGKTTVTWTVTDGSGLTTTCSFDVIVNTSLSATVASSSTLPQGVEVNTVYNGYAPASVINFTANASGGSGSYTYKWSVSNASFGIVNGTANAKTVNVNYTGTGDASATLTVIVNDGYGCDDTVHVQVFGKDIRCGNKMDKVLVCQKTESAKNPWVQICIAPQAVATHLANGSTLGNCNANARTAPTVPIVKATAIKAYPNPSNGVFELQLIDFAAGKVQVQIIDNFGKIVDTRAVTIGYKREDVSFNLKHVASGVYQVRVVSSEGVTSTKVVIAR